MPECVTLLPDPFTFLFAETIPVKAYPLPISGSNITSTRKKAGCVIIIARRHFFLFDFLSNIIY